MTTLTVMATANNIYHIKSVKKNTSSNYNTFVSVYIKGDKSPLFGTSFIENTPLEDVKAWANNRIEQLNDQNLNLF